MFKKGCQVDDVRRSGLLQWHDKLLYKIKMWQPLTVCCQGLQFSRVCQTAGNLQFNPMRFQAEQSLEQKLTLRKRVMFCTTVVEHLSSVSRCLLKGQYLYLSRTNLIKRLHTDLLENNCIFSHRTPEKCSLFEYCRNVGRYIQTVCHDFVPVWQCLALFPGPKRLSPRQVTPPQLSASPGPTVCESQQKEEGGVCHPWGERGRLEYSPQVRCWKE